MAEADDRTLKEGSEGRWRHARLLPVVCLAVVLVVYLLFLMGRFVPAIATPDANGYWAQGSLLATTGRTWFVPEADTQYVGVHWLVTDDGPYFSRYPPGLAVLVAVVYATLGFKASVLVDPALAALSLVGLYLLARRFVGPWWALAAVGALAINPVFNEQATWCFAHIAVTFCLVWGLHFLVLWSERGALWEIFTASVFLGCIPTVRYPEALFALGVVVFVLWHARGRKRFWRHAASGAAGAALPTVPLLVRNQLAFGAFYETGYALTNEQTGFGWNYFGEHFVSYVRGLNSDGVGLFFALGAVGIVMMCAVRRWRRTGVLLALLVVPTTLLYMAYYWGGMGPNGGGMTMRFLLPTFACYVVAGTWLLAHVTRESSRVLKVAAVAVVLLLQFVWGALHTNDEGRRLRFQKEVLARVTDALEKHIEHGDVVIANEQILQHLDFVRHWRLVDPMALRPIGGAMRFMPGMGTDADSDEPMPMQREKLAARLEKYKGMSRPEQALALARDVDTWAGERKVYFVGPEDELSGLRGPFGERTFGIVARIKLPEAPATNEMRFGPAGMPMPPGLGPGGAVPRVARDGPDLRERSGPGIARDRAFRRRFGGMGGPGGPGGQYGDELVIAQWIGRPPMREEQHTAPADATGPQDDLGPPDDFGPPDFFGPPDGASGDPDDVPWAGRHSDGSSIWALTK